MRADIQELLHTSFTLIFPNSNSCDRVSLEQNVSLPLTFSGSIKHLNFQADAYFLLLSLIMAWYGAYVNFVDCRFLHLQIV